MAARYFLNAARQAESFGCRKQKIEQCENGLIWSPKLGVAVFGLVTNALLLDTPTPPGWEQPKNLKIAKRKPSPAYQGVRRIT